VLALAGVAVVIAELTVFSQLIRPAAAVARIDNDPCLLGFWVEESRRITRPINEQQRAEFTGSGTVHAFNRDGTAATFYGSEAAERAVVNGQTFELLVSGAIRWRYTARDGALRFTDPQPAASAFVRVDGDRGDTFAVTPQTAGNHVLPTSYVCGHDSATASAPGSSILLRRIGYNAG
jgi:hypothetical protein